MSLIVFVDERKEIGATEDVRITATRKERIPARK
jgi:hypothetical protein